MEDNNDNPNHNTTIYCGHIKHCYNYQLYVMLYWSLFLHVSQSESYLILDSHQTRHLKIISVKFESVSTIQIRKLNMKRVQEITTDNHKRKLLCPYRPWQTDGRQMLKWSCGSMCKKVKKHMLSLPENLGSPPVFSEVHYKLCNVS